MSGLEKIKAQDVMSKRVITLTADMSLREALETMADEKISGAPVTDKEGNLAGVISMTDIVGFEVGRIRNREPKRALYYSLADFEGSEDIGRFDDDEPPEEILDSTTVGDAMTRVAITVSPETPLGKVARVMTRDRIHRVIVTEAFKVVGLVSSMDILKAIAKPPLGAGMEE